MMTWANVKTAAVGTAVALVLGTGAAVTLNQAFAQPGNGTSPAAGPAGPTSTATTTTTPITAVATVAAAAAAQQATVSNLQELVDAARAGSEVTIPKGSWKDPIKIDKPLTLRGEHRDECVIDVESDQPAILVTSKKEVVLENVTIRWKRATSAQPQEPQAAIVAKDATFVLRNARVEAPDNFARCPSGFGALGFCDVKLEGCQFEGFEFTIAFSGGAKGSVTDCVVSNPGHCGISSLPDSTVHVARTIVTGSRYHGLRCTGGELTAENNLVIANKNRGFYLGNKPARGAIRENVIMGNGTGVSAFAESEVTVHNNLIAGSDYAAVDMRDTCRLDVERNLLANNARGIVLFKETGTNRNTIGKNASAGNKAETEGFDPAPELEEVEGELAEGEFTMKGAKGFGLSDAAWVKPLWERWTELGAGGAE